MSFDSQDPKWTAYVVGELDASERAAVESELQASPEARHWVAEVRETVRQLERELRAEPSPGLSAEQRAALLAGVSNPMPVSPPTVASAPTVASSPTAAAAAIATAPFHETVYSGHRWSGGGLAVIAALAAMVMIAAGLFLPSIQRDTEAERRLAHADAQPKAPGGAKESLDQLRAPYGALNVNDESAAGKPEGALASPQPPREPLQASELTTETLSVGQPTHEQKLDGRQGVITVEAFAWRSLDEVEKSSVPFSGSAGGPGQSPALRAASGAKDQPMPVAGSANGIGGLGQAARTPQSGGSRAKAAGKEAVDSDRSMQGEYSAAAPAAYTGGIGGSANAAAAKMGHSPADGLKQIGLGLQTRHTLRDAESPRGYVGFEADTISRPESNTEAYAPITDNAFLPVAQQPLSTFSVDVDTASYSIVRRFLLQDHTLPPPSAVRIEELVNYFPYHYAPPTGDVPFAVHAEVAACPWNSEHRLLRIGLKGREIAADKRPNSNLVFLLDVSGSMDDYRKLPLVKEAMRLLVRQLGENDRVAIVVYAGSSGLVLPSTTGDQKARILAAIENLRAGGSTNGGEGIGLAYDVAAGAFIKGGVNRVILATDGDFNVGVTNHDDLIRLIQEKAKSGVFLTTLGFGMGNLKDNTLEQLADKGNGAYAYIDNLREARKVFVEQMSGTLVTIAKDVKLQLEFNPGQVAEYRLIGYENRALKKEDFNNDKVDAGDIGAGHTVTALYELVPAPHAAGAATDTAQAAPAKTEGVDPLKYSRPVALAPSPAAASDELLTLKLRYKQPQAGESQLIEQVIKDPGQAFAKASDDFRFASSVALFGMLLRDSPYRGQGAWSQTLEMAADSIGADEGGYRSEFLDMVRTAKQLKGQ